ncbi:DNA-directed RNA polymerase subunit alpha C-terminal domain-containing protein [Neisseriaceae bacterium CLB008]
MQMKIVQIVSVEKALFALTEDGCLWEFDIQKREWRRCKAILNEEENKQLKDATLISQLFVSGRVQKALHGYGLQTVGDLLRVSESERQRIPRLGRKSLFELEKALNQLEAQFL